MTVIKTGQPPVLVILQKGERWWKIPDGILVGHNQHSVRRIEIPDGCEVEIKYEDE